MIEYKKEKAKNKSIRDEWTRKKNEKDTKRKREKNNGRTKKLLLSTGSYSGAHLVV